VAQQPLTGATMAAPPPRSQRSRTAADSLLQAARERGAILEDVAKATGGSFQQVHLESGLQAALDGIRQQILGEYVLSYGGPADGGDDSSLRLRVKLPGVQVSMWPLAARPAPRGQP
jgi:hypothetical protein